MRPRGHGPLHFGVSTTSGQLSCPETLTPARPLRPASAARVMCSRGVTSLCVAGGALLLMSIHHYASHRGSRHFHGEAHQQAEVDSSLQILRGLAPALRRGRSTIKAQLVADDADVPAGAMKVHFIRHGEGVHNVAQREWRSRPEYDGRSEPYTLDNDPSGKYTDALLTSAGEAQARALQVRPCMQLHWPASQPASQPVGQPASQLKLRRLQDADLNYL